MPGPEVRGRGSRAQTKSLPPQLTAYQMISQGKYLCRWSFLGQAAYLLHPTYHKVKSNFRYGFY